MEFQVLFVKGIKVSISGNSHNEREIGHFKLVKWKNIMDDKYRNYTLWWEMSFVFIKLFISRKLNDVYLMIFVSPNVSVGHFN